MNILLVYPRWDYPTFGELQEPLGIMHIGAMLKRVGHNVRLLDLTVEPIEALDAALPAAEMAGMSTSTAMYGRACRVLDRIKAARPDLPVVLGGPHATVLPAESLRRGFDAVALGEGEHTAVELAEAIAAGGPLHEVAGAVALKDGEPAYGPPRPFEPNLDDLPDADRELIRYLLGHQHTSPFEMVEFKFHVKLPIFVARQWIRHRTANVNEYSGRYSVMKEEFYQPEADQIRLQSDINKQGRSEEQVPTDLQEDFLNHSSDIQKRVYEKYNHYITAGLARELARINLPLSLYTEWYWKIDLHNLLHFLRLRMNPHAQYEIRQYAIVMGDIVKAICPISWEAFEDYILNAQRFSATELRILKATLSGFTLDRSALVAAGLSTLEADEFLGKLGKIKDLL